MNNGGPAFPKTTTILPNQHSGSEQHRLGFTVAGEGGMTMRDWFAGQALAGLIAKAPSAEVTARDCYTIADAMLSARDAPKPGCPECGRTETHSHFVP